MPSANVGTRHLNRCKSPLDCMIDDVMHFFVIFQSFSSTRLEHCIFMCFICIVVVPLKTNLTLGLVIVWNCRVLKGKSHVLQLLLLRYMCLYGQSLQFLLWRSVGTNSWSFCGLWPKRVAARQIHREKEGEREEKKGKRGRFELRPQRIRQPDRVDLE